MYQLRSYQKEAVRSAIKHFQRKSHPALIVLPTGAGKSLVIAELARLARGRVLCLAHVKELVEQNHQKYMSYGLEAGIYAAGLGRKDFEQKVVFASIQSVARAAPSFFEDFSLVVIDECHRVSLDEGSQYQQVITKLFQENPKLCLLGLTATPYRLGLGWIYQYHYRGFVASGEPRFFKECIYELSLKYMIYHGYLTPPLHIDAPVSCYDFSQLRLSTKNGRYSPKEVQACLNDQERITPRIIDHIVAMSEDRQGVMIFAATLVHAREILGLLPEALSALVAGDTPQHERDSIIKNFKGGTLKYLVNVSVLTTGFDAPHVDLIALLRPTESVGLFQQIVGRGLRLAPGKKDCILLDYTGLGFDVYEADIDDPKPDRDTEQVLVSCPECGYENQFWGRTDGAGHITEHFGRKCRGAFEDPVNHDYQLCGFRFRFKVCDSCGSENDIAARMCCNCREILVDPDERLKQAMALKDAHVMRPDTMLLGRGFDKKRRERLEVSYYDVDAQVLREYYYLDSAIALRAFYYKFSRIHNKSPGTLLDIKSLEDALDQQDRFRMPAYLVARKKQHYWEIREKIF